jgi:hypothetical protein
MYLNVGTTHSRMILSSVIVVIEYKFIELSHWMITVQQVQTPASFTRMKGNCLRVTYTRRTVKFLAIGNFGTVAFMTPSVTL